MSIQKNSKIYIAGHRGLVGSAIYRNFLENGYINIFGATRYQVDLTNQHAVNDFFYYEKPEYVILSAAKVGGIGANDKYRADFLYENLMIEANVIRASYEHKVKKLLFLGSSCIYPKNGVQPLKEEYLLTGALEPTNEPYAIAKIAGIRLCDAYSRQYGVNFISAMPTNIYGVNDNYNPETSHVLPALIHRFHEAKVAQDDVVSCWGSGNPMREFLYVDDLAEACRFLMENINYSDLTLQDETGTIHSHINVGSGKLISIRDLADCVKEVVGFTGDIKWDTSKPDGTLRKLMDSSRLENMGWSPKISLKDGITRAYDDYKLKVKPI
jgi:GDP-L-fucose synthase